MTTKTTKTTNMQRRQSKAASPKFSIAHKGCLAGVSPLEEEAKAMVEEATPKEPTLFDE